ncbi:hypothetical protein J1N35_001932 [Gossypium stocksii]|uniref:Uncharacterized protein n=1 Tax=Gossypium stocksii TaxID=47602 RepID=A0A9D3WK29_9ROSI|nr:hypothetical protein J1N35_001932 [Gossypium stocksii]
MSSLLLSQDPLPSSNRVFQQITQEKHIHDITWVKEKKPKILGFAVRTKGCNKARGMKWLHVLTYMTVQISGSRNMGSRR